MSSNFWVRWYRASTKIALVVAALLSVGTATRAETVSELVNRGLVLLDSHMGDGGTIFMIVGTVDGGPQYICQTRYRVAAESDFDNCRVLK